MELRAAALLALLAAPASAGPSIGPDACRSVDFSARFGPPRQQGGSEWCWASTAADLIGFYQGITPRQQLSLIDVALSGLTVTPDGLVRGGLRTNDWGSYRTSLREGADLDQWRRKKRGLALLRRSGWSLYAVFHYNTRDRLCLESELPSRVPPPFSASAPGRRPFPPPADPPLVLRGPEADQGEAVDFLRHQLRALGDESTDTRNIPYIARVAAACTIGGAPLLSSQSDLFEEFNEWVLRDLDHRLRRRCVAGKPVRPMSGSVVDFPARGDASEAADLAAEWLRENGPFSVSMRSGFFSAGGAASGNWHEIVVSGMRWNQAAGRCEFILRNSEGESCGKLREALASRCSAGNVWVTEDELRSETRFATRVRLAR